MRFTPNIGSNTINKQKKRKKKKISEKKKKKTMQNKCDVLQKRLLYLFLALLFPLLFPYLHPTHNRIGTIG